jgi:ATP-dependent RNA helicase HelY
MVITTLGAFGVDRCVTGEQSNVASAVPANRVGVLLIAREESRFVRDDARRPRGRSGWGRRTVNYGNGSYGGAAHHSRCAGTGRRPHSLRVPSRPELVELLDDEELLPAIVFHLLARWL